ncbi:MAG: HIT family protein [Bacteroidota bacterium]
MDCIFCKIINRELPASIVYEDDKCMAFMDIRPINPGHLLIVPKQHIAYWHEMDPDLAGYLFAQGIRMNNAIRNSDLKCEGVNMLANDGAAAFQEVFHAHLHIIPRFRGDGFKVRFSGSVIVPPSRNKLDAIAMKIKNKLTL